MPTPGYPVALPGPSSFAWTAGSQLVATEGDGVPLAMRRVSRVPVATANVSFRFLETDYAVFREWYKTDLLYGHRWFTLPLFSAAGVVDHVCRFSNRPKGSARGHRWFDVNAELEVRERKTNDAQAPYVYVDVDLPSPTYNFAVYSPTSSYLLNTLNSAKQYRVSLPPGRTYTAWTAWPNPLAPGAPVNRWYSAVRFRDVVTDIEVEYRGDDAATEEAARKLWSPVTIQGAVYRLWMYDPNPTDDIGGLSLRFTEL